MSSGSPSASVAPTVAVRPGEHNLNARSAHGFRASTFWCYECDAGVSLNRSAHPLCCPICSGGFLEEMELHQAQDHGGRGPREAMEPLYSDMFPLESDDDGELLPPVSPPPIPDYSLDTDDDSDPRHRLYFRTFADFLPPVIESPAEDLLADLVPEDDPPTAAGHAPAPKASIDAIPVVPVTDSFLADDPHRLCAVCKDEFVLGSEAKRLPCSHIYHGDCIVPWLFRHNSCPLCRSQLPVPSGSNRRSRPRLPARFRVSHFPTFEASNAPTITPADGHGGFSSSPPPANSNGRVAVSSPPHQLVAATNPVGRRRRVAAARPPRSDSRDFWSYYLLGEGMDEETDGNLVIDDSYRAWLEAHVEMEPTNNVMVDDSYQSWLEQHARPTSNDLTDVSYLSWLVASSTRVVNQPDWDYFFELREDTESPGRQHNGEGHIVCPRLQEDVSVGAEGMGGREDPAIPAPESTLP